MLMKVIINRWLKVNEIQILVIGFLVLIFIGAVLLAMPISSQDGRYTNFLDCVFISTSATCVTGLVTLDTGTHWNYFGQFVILCLIQIGGLGFMSVSTLIALLMGRRITLKERLVIQQSLNSFSIQGLVKMSKYVLVFTFVVETIGAMFLATQFIPEFGYVKGIYFSIFHSISAFCNAGIDLIGEFRSLTPYAEDPVIILTVGSLVVIGGLGFFVWQDIYNFRIRKKLSLHTRLVIVTTLILILGGTILMFLFEMYNPKTIGDMPVKSKILSSLFASIVPRTAGFNSIPTSDMTGGGKFLTIVLMFIGGSPGSTAGGIKTTTAALLIVTVLSIIRGREDAEIYGRRIRKELVYRALTITILGSGIVLVATILLCITEKASLEYIIYEVVSAFGTVGLSLGLTPELSNSGKILLCIIMYCGRLGPLTVALALAQKSMPSSIKYPDGKILIG
ncbi:Ktr system potassium uptake protein B [Clostridium magnum DSM 2767]|uniref:Ktr system potassium uptake protein B n=2 Tax=Clostridium magnum TaxID=33954 RepID=A0A162U964_9CLOT|nr:Ktr system potassium uptake protein B [Clostridium magnum DSM 2767]SHI93341.1 trk system potassium uptake protein TrkH [Clostridium magnum DSM 2767]